MNAERWSKIKNDKLFKIAVPLLLALILVSPAASFGSLLEDVTGSFNLIFDKSNAGTDGGTTETVNTASYQVNNQKSFNAGTYNGTSADRNDNSGILGIGYRNKTVGTQLVGYFRLDDSSVSGTGGSVQDYSGESGSATATNGVTTDYPGVFSTNAYDLDGTDDRVDLPQSFGIFDGSSNYTISTWFNADQVAPGSDYQTSPVILSFNSERNIFLTFGDSYSGDTLGLRVEGQSSGWFTPVLYDGINTDQWYHVTATYNTVNGYKFYLNGEEKDSNPTTDLPTSGSASSMIGGFGDSQSNRFFNGTVDELRIFDTSLSASEVRRFHFNTSMDKYFEGNYTSKKIDTGSTQSWNQLYVDSTVPDIVDSFSVDTGSEWNSDGTINNGLNVSGSNLELKASDITYTEKFNVSYGDTVNGVAVDSDGNVYAVGRNNNIVKFDSNGNEEWSYNYGDWINDVAVESSGNVYAAGDNFGPNNDNIVKLDSSGNLIWSANVGGDSMGLDLDSQGNVIAASDTDDTIVKYNSEGVEQWTYNYDDIVGSEPAVDSDDNIYFGGNSEFVKLNSSGVEELRDSGYDAAAIDIGPEGYIYVSDGARIYKLDQSRNEIWEYYTGTSFNELATDSNGNIYAADEDLGNPKLLKLDNGGNKVWSYTTSEPVPTVGLSGSIVAFGTHHDVISLYDPDYSDSGDYTSNVFDSGSISSFSDFETSSSLVPGTDANVTVRLSNSSDMSGSVSKKLNLAGGTESKLLETKAQYAQFTVNMSGDESDTPQLDRVSIDYSAEPTTASAVFRALDSSGNIQDSQVIDLSTESTNHSLEVSNSEDAEVVFNGTSTKASKTWEINEFKVYYGSPADSIKSEKTSTQSEYNQGTFNGTSADRRDNSGDLGIGYLNGTTSDEMQLYYRFDSSDDPYSGSAYDVKDYSGNGINATNNAADRVNNGVLGTNAFDFDGSTTGNILTGKSINAPTTGTISFWIGNRTDPPSQFERPFGYDDGFEARMNDANHEDGTILFDICITGSNSVTHTDTHDWIGKSWYHVAYTWNDTSNEFSVYVDGERETSGTASGMDCSQISASKMCIGASRSDCGTDPYNGSIDEFQIYDRELQPNEINEVYFHGSDGTFNGNYTSKMIDTGSTQSWDQLYVDSTISSQTSVNATFKALNSDGSVVDSQLINLNTEAVNHSLTVSDSEDARVVFNGTSTNTTKTWKVNEFITYYTGASGGGTTSSWSKFG